MLVLKSKIVLHGAASREAILRGVDLLADAVKVTLGPKGRNVVIGRRIFGLDPAVTKDGVTVANVVSPTDPTEQIGADLLRSAAQKTVDNAGDGTTTSVVLAQAMLHAGFKALESGASPIAVKRGMDRACLAIVQAIRRMAVPVSEDMLLQVARIASNGDEALAEIVAAAIAKVGKDGVVTVEESRTLDTHLEIVSGLQLNSGFLSPYFVTDPQTMRCEYENALVCLWEGNLSSAKSLVPLLNLSDGKPLLIVAGDYEHEALAVLATNRIKRGFQVVAVRTGAFGDRRREILRDLAAVTGGTAFTEDVGAKIDNITAGDLGKARKIVVDEKKTLIVADDSEARLARTREIRNQMLEATGVDKAHLQVRLSGLAGGVAVIKVGAVTEVEMKEKKDRAEDAMYAVKAAAEEGVVPGGGLALYWAAANHSGNDAGALIVMNACASPMKQIALNAGIEPRDVIAQTVAHDRELGAWGYNAFADRYENLSAAGVLDPAKVVIEALKNAVSVAGMILTTEAMVAEELVDDGR